MGTIGVSSLAFTSVWGEGRVGDGTLVPRALLLEGVEELMQLRIPSHIYPIHRAIVLLTCQLNRKQHDGVLARTDSPPCPSRPSGPKIKPTSKAELKVRAVLTVQHAAPSRLNTTMSHRNARLTAVQPFTHLAAPQPLLKYCDRSLRTAFSMDGWQRIFIRSTAASS